MSSTGTTDAPCLVVIITLLILTFHPLIPLSGHDLNRRWLKTDPVLHPEIAAFKNMLEVTARERPLMMFCDLHGHSNKKNMFVYGCAAEYWRPQVIAM